MTHHDKSRKLVKIGVIWLLELDMHDEANAITALAEENRMLREWIRQADNILEDLGFAIELGARRVLRAALSSTGEKGNGGRAQM